jgi:hypothetical protein
LQSENLGRRVDRGDRLALAFAEMWRELPKRDNLRAAIPLSQKENGADFR